MVQESKIKGWIVKKSFQWLPLALISILPRIVSPPPWANHGKAIWVNGIMERRLMVVRDATV
jgi:hypothetical protein